MTEAGQLASPEGFGGFEPSAGSAHRPGHSEGPRTLQNKPFPLHQLTAISDSRNKEVLFICRHLLNLPNGDANGRKHITKVIVHLPSPVPQGPLEPETTTLCEMPLRLKKSPG
jgi:hypothetical protein